MPVTRFQVCEIFVRIGSDEPAIELLNDIGQICPAVIFVTDKQAEAVCCRASVSCQHSLTYSSSIRRHLGLSS
jgi:hypothetical protein